jgi:hypothetical protein
VVLGVDAAQALTRHPRTDRKRRLAVVEEGDGQRSSVLAGPPQLGNALRRPTREAIGSRTAICPLEGLAGRQRESLQGLLPVWTAGQLEPERLRPPDALDLLARTLRPPLHLQRHLPRALEGGDQTGEPPIAAPMVEPVRSHPGDALEPPWTRPGYPRTDLVHPCDATPTDIKALVNNQLAPARTAACRDRLLRAGLPLCIRAGAAHGVWECWLAVLGG